MDKLFLLRHAHAALPSPGQSDFDRPLTPGGVEDARAIGLAARHAGHQPALALCSTARRARETLDAFAGQQVDAVAALHLDQLYHGSADDYLALVREHGAAGPILVVGHNPMTERLALRLAGDGEPQALAELRGGFPTSGLAVLRFEHGLRIAAPGDGFLESFLLPER